jgi:hypothetical protein
MAKQYEEYEIRDLHGRHKDGYEDQEKPKPGDTTYDVAKLKPRSTELISQDRYDARHPAHQANQAREDAHAPNYNNDTRDGWLRGSGAGGGEDYPNFDHSKPRSQMRR